VKKDSWIAKKCSCISLDIIRPFFDINTAQVKTRLINAVVPLKFPAFYKEYAEKPDLYGPTWVLATLVCFLFITGNI